MGNDADKIDVSEIFEERERERWQNKKLLVGTKW